MLIIIARRVVWTHLHGLNITHKHLLAQFCKATILAAAAVWPMYHSHPSTLGVAMIYDTQLYPSVSEYIGAVTGMIWGILMSDLTACTRTRVLCACT